MLVDFYHLARPVEWVLPRLAQQLHDRGGRLLIVADDERFRARLDDALWTWSAESFLPHSLAGDRHAAAQPILIAETSDEPANGARNIALADGQWRDAALRFDRVFHLFDPSMIDDARRAWKALAGTRGCERRYWKQDEGGRWEQAG